MDFTDSFRNVFATRFQASAAAETIGPSIGFKHVDGVYSLSSTPYSVFLATGCSRSWNPAAGMAAAAAANLENAREQWEVRARKAPEYCCGGTPRIGTRAVRRPTSVGRRVAGGGARSIKWMIRRSGHPAVSTASPPAEAAAAAVFVDAGKRTAPLPSPPPPPLPPPLENLLSSKTLDVGSSPKFSRDPVNTRPLCETREKNAVYT